MNPFTRRNIKICVLNIVIAGYGAVFAIAAPLAPETVYLASIKGVIAPVRLAVDPAGKLFVSDPRSGGVMQYDHAGNFVKKIPVKGARGVAIAPQGELVVTHGNGVSLVNTETGASLVTFGSFKQSNGVALDDSGRIYVVDTLDSVVQVFSAAGQPVPVRNSATGKPANSFGSSGSSSGQLSLPTAIAYDHIARQLIVTDTGNSRLVFFDQDGAFVRAIGAKSQNGTAPVFTSPQSISLEYTKTSPQKLQRIYVSDSFQSEVQIIDPQGSGEFLGSIGGYGVTPGKLKVPVDTLFEADSSRLLVANGSGEITIYGINVISSPLSDTIPPLLTLDPLPLSTVTNGLVIGGTAEKGAQLQIEVPQGVVAGPVSSLPGTDASVVFWQAAISGLKQGANDITVTARDSAYNPTVRTARIIYDPGTVRMTLDPFASPVNNSVQLLSGTADQGAVISLAGATGVTFSAVTYSGSVWQSTVSGLTEGVNVIVASAALGGKVSSTTTRILLITSRPRLDVSTLPDSSKTAQPVLNVSGTLPLGIYLDSLIVNGTPVTVQNNAFSSVVNLKPGMNQVAVTARDTAGNVSGITRTLYFDDTLPTVLLTEPPDGSYVNGTDVNLKGSVQPGNTVRILLYNGSASGVPFTQVVITPDGAWSTTAAIPLDPGLNTIVVEVTDKSGISSRIKTTITRDATIPPLAVTTPIRDIAQNRSSLSVSGAVPSGVSVTAALDGSDVPVLRGTAGTYTIPVSFSEEKLYALAITATDPLGNSDTAYRNIVYDITAPMMTVDPQNHLKVTFNDGVPVVVDKNGAVAGVITTVNADGSRTVDIGSASGYDAASLDIHAVDAAGNSTRNGDVNGDGIVDIQDAYKLLRLAVQLDNATTEQKLRGDVAPLLGGVSKPDGALDVFDVVYVLEKTVGLR